MTEFALVIPILLLLFLAIFDAGRLIFTYNTVANAARDAARVAIVNQATSGTDTCDTTSATVWPQGCAIVSGVSLGLTPANVAITYFNPDNPSQSGPTPQFNWVAQVTVTTTFNAITPVIGQLIGPVQISSTSKIPVERTCISSC